MNGLRPAILLLAAMVSTTGCLGLFGGEDAGPDTNATSISQNVDQQTQEQILERASSQFRNYTVQGQEALESIRMFLNGTLNPGQGVGGVEDRNDRAGINYGTTIIKEDISSQIPPGQPALIKAKLWYFASAGSSGDLDIYVNVPGTETEMAGDDCDEFSWKVCVQELTVSTVGVSGHPAEVGIQVANGRVAESMDYFLQVDIAYAHDVITPFLPYAVTAPENATGLVFTSEKVGGADHIRAEFMVIGPDDELVEYVSYNDISVASESKLVPISQPGEYVVYIPEITGGFLGVEADVPVPKDVRQVRPLDRVEESVADGSAPAPGVGESCPADQGACPASSAGGTAKFAVEGTFPLEVIGWIGESGQQANANAEIAISSQNGRVFKLDKWAQYQDDQGTMGMSRDDLHRNATFENLAKGEYTVTYTIDGTATVGHTIVTYKR